MNRETILILKLLAVIILVGGIRFLFKYVMLNFKSFLKPKAAPIEERLKINKQFSTLMKERKLNREEILYLKKYIYKLTKEPDKNYKNDCHYICHCIKHCDLSLRDLYEINLIIERR